jgi:hypothetical protein
LCLAEGNLKVHKFSFSFPKIYEPLLNSRRENCDVLQDRY